MIRAPNSHSPVQHPDRARDRRDMVLRQMRELGFIDDKRLPRRARSGWSSSAGPCRPSRPTSSTTSAPRSSSPSRRTASGRRRPPDLHDAGPGPPARGRGRGDPRARPARGPVPRSSAGPRPASGSRRRWWPSTRHRRDPRAGRGARLLPVPVQPRRPRPPAAGLRLQAVRLPGRAGPGAPGRAAPPHAGLGRQGRALHDRIGRDTWTPRNYENRFEGPVTVRRALEQSLNAATVVAEAGLPAVVRRARDAGFTSPLQPVPALALGSFEVTPIELAGAYATLANDGERIRRPACARSWTAPARSSEPRAARAGAPADEAYLLTYLLRGVIDRGTGAPAARSGSTASSPEDRDDQRRPRHVVRRVLAPAGRAGVGGLRRAGRPEAVGRAGRAADLGRLHADGHDGAAGGGSRPPASVTFRDVDLATGKLATRPARCPSARRSWPAPSPGRRAPTTARPPRSARSSAASSSRSASGAPGLPPRGQE